MSIIETILDLQNVYYLKHRRAVSMIYLNKDIYKKLLYELEVKDLGNLHGMQIIINSKHNIKLI